MSFILDALKKSEERRQQDQPQHSRKHIITLRGSHRRRWPLWLVLVLLPLALFSGWWLGRTSESTVPAAMQESVKREPLLDSQAATSPDSPGETAETAPIIPAPVPSRPQPPVPAREPSLPKGSASQASSPEETLEKAAVKLPTKGTSPISSYADLSREAKSRLPRLEISLHYYSADPARRMVRLNDQLLHEGDTVADGLTIDEITPSSTVLDFHGLLFQLDRP